MSKMNRRALLSAAASLAATAPAIIANAATSHAVVGADPIFAALEMQRERWLAHGAAIRAYDAACTRHGFDSPEAEAADALAGPLCDADTEGRLNLLSVTPATLAGMFAYLAFVQGPEGFGEMAMEGDDLSTMVATVHRFLCSTPGIRIV